MRSVIFEWEETLGVICDLKLFMGDALCVCAREYV
jgi:hypothetical protein